MAGVTIPKPSSTKPPPPSSSSDHRHCRREHPFPASDCNPFNPNADFTTRPPSNTNPSPSSHLRPQPEPIRHPGDLSPAPPLSYGFHMLERRTLVLSDGTVRSYYALPPDYHDLIPRHVAGGPVLGGPGGLNPSGLVPDGSMKRKFVGEEGKEDGLGKRLPPGGPVLGGPSGLNPLGVISPGGSRPVPDGSMKRNFVGEAGNDGLGKRLPLGGPVGGPRGMNPLGLISPGRSGPVPDGSMKRNFVGEQGKGGLGKRQQLLNYGNGDVNLGHGSSSVFGKDGEDNRAMKHVKVGDVGARNDVDPVALKKVFMHFVKLINENVSQRKKYLDIGRHGPVQCVVCGGSSKDFPDMHGLIMHTYNFDNTDSCLDHLGLHKALCVLMGWDSTKPPDSSRMYQRLPPNEAAANQDDLIIWPPTVIIHNTITGKGKGGRMEGLGNKAMNGKIRGLGITGGKSKALYNKDGHLGITLVKFSADLSGLKQAILLAERFESDSRGRSDWARVQSMSDREEENNLKLVEVDPKTGEKSRILYGYLGIASDLDKFDFENRKKVVIESKEEQLRAIKV